MCGQSRPPQERPSKKGLRTCKTGEKRKKRLMQTENNVPHRSRWHSDVSVCVAQISKQCHLLNDDRNPQNNVAELE